MSKKALWTTVLLVALAGAGVWYVLVRNSTVEIANPDSPEFQERMHAVEKASATKAEDAKAGVGVAPPGTLPPPPPPVEEATTSDVVELEAE